MEWRNFGCWGNFSHHYICSYQHWIVYCSIISDGDGVGDGDDDDVDAAAAAAPAAADDDDDWNEEMMYDDKKKWYWNLWTNKS